jgi:formylglycine-generating enzyme required for sulfatase activity
MAEEETKLRAFKDRLSHFAPQRCEIDGDLAVLGDNFIRLLRLRPTDKTSISKTFISILPVTNAQYRTFLEVTNYQVPPTWNRIAFRAETAPVTGISWFEASAFASWIGGSLLTEADWEIAAQGNDTRRAYATASGQIATNLAHIGQPFGATAPDVATAYPPNAEGFFGMCGNVWDWCANPWGLHRAIRGGGCMDIARFCAIGARYRNLPLDRDCCVGFRVKITIDPRN